MATRKFYRQTTINGETRFISRDSKGSDDPYKVLINWYDAKHVVGIYKPAERWSNGQWRVVFPALPSASPADFSASKFKALDKVAAAYRGTSIDLGNTIVEGQQTMRMVHGFLKSVVVANRALRRGDLGSFFRSFGAQSHGSQHDLFRKKVEAKIAAGKPVSGFLRAAAKRGPLSRAERRRLNAHDISNAHLALVYGWVPTLSDIHEAATNWAAVTGGPRELHIARQASAESSYGVTAFGIDEVAVNRRTRCRATVTVRERLSTARRLGLLDWAGPLWELTPWSFVVDWVIPIGDYLDALNTFAGADASVHYANKDTALITPVRMASGFRGFYGSVLREVRFVREAPGPVVIPKPSVVPLRDIMSPQRFWNALALIHQLRRP